MTFWATSRRIGDSLRNEVDVNGRHTIVTDEPLALGGDDEGPTPHELLAAAIASCVGTMIEMYARRKDWDVRGVEVEAVYDNESTPRAVMVEIRLEGRLSAEQEERLLRVARTCPVRRALESEFSFRERLSVHAEPAAP